MKTISFPTDERSDQELMAAITNSQCERSFEEVCRRHRSTLRSVIMRVLGSESDVDDVLQDVYIQVWSHAGTYSPDRGQPLGWLITLARRRAIDRMRQFIAYQKVTGRYETEAKPLSLIHI